MATIQSDLETGEPAILLVDLPDQPFMPRGRRRRKLHKSVVFRWRERDGLEALRTPSGLITTRSAVLRFFARMTNPDSEPASRTSRQRLHDLSLAEAELAAAGV